MSRMGIPSPTTSSTTTSPLAWSVFPVCGQWFYPCIIISYYLCIGVVCTTHLMLTDSSHTWSSTTTPSVWSVPPLSCSLTLTWVIYYNDQLLRPSAWYVWPILQSLVLSHTHPLLCQSCVPHIIINHFLYQCVVSATHVIFMDSPHHHQQPPSVVPPTLGSLIPSPTTSSTTNFPISVLASRVSLILFRRSSSTTTSPSVLSVALFVCLVWQSQQHHQHCVCSQRYGLLLISHTAGTPSTSLSSLWSEQRFVHFCIAVIPDVISQFSSGVVSITCSSCGTLIISCALLMCHWCLF